MQVMVGLLVLQVRKVLRESKDLKGRRAYKVLRDHRD